MKVIDYLINSIRRQTHPSDLFGLAPTAVLWTDKDCVWQSAMPLIKAAMPELYELGDYEPQQRRGPAVWLKCVTAGLAGSVPEGRVPVLYLPGISRRELRAVEDCPTHLVSLAELQYRSRWWATPNNNRDWSINAFLSNKMIGLELDVAKDSATQERLLQVLEPLLEADAASLKNKRITSAVLGGLVVEDPIRDLLHWLDSPSIVNEWAPMRVQLLEQYCLDTYGLSAEEANIGEFLSHLCEQPKPAWEALWSRFEDMASLLPGLLAKLESVEPLALPLRSECFLSLVIKDEKTLEKSFVQFAGQSDLEVDDGITRLAQEHASRRDTLWLRLGYTPYTQALLHMATLVEKKNKPLGGPNCDVMASAYERNFWQLDRAALKAMACAQHDSQREVIAGVLSIIYTPWLTHTAERFQALVKSGGYPNAPGASPQERALNNEYKSESQVVFFVDGLRFDVAHDLVEVLDKTYGVELSAHWSALPSVTATAKAAITPVSSCLEGDLDGHGFVPGVKENGSEFSSGQFRKLLKEAGWQYLDGVETGDPAGRAWVQTGDLDKTGHKEQRRLPSRIDDILDEVKSRIDGLKQAGWQHIRVVTDHGWLWVPDKLPKAEIAKLATVDKNPRCAVLNHGAPTEHLTSPWYWNENVSIAFAPGISAFRAGLYYEHGGISLQECLTPVIDIC